MLHLPNEFQVLISTFSDIFSRRVFKNVGYLLLGCILTQGKRTVCGVLRTLGLDQANNWHKYHRVLSRAKWSGLQFSKRVLELLISQFIADNTLILGIDETLERRWGNKILAKGLFHDAVRSTKKVVVKCTGLRWICLMVLVEVPWAHAIWALPFLSVLAPSKRYHKQMGKPHKTLVDWARQIALQLHRWLPNMKIIIVGDNSYARMELFKATMDRVCWITRMRFDACFYDFPPVEAKRSKGRPKKKGTVQPKLSQRLNSKSTVWTSICFSHWYGQVDKWMEISEGTAIWYRAGKAAIPLKWIIIRDPEGKHQPAAIVCTDIEMDMEQIVIHFVKRWRVEVTFQEVRAHLGVETQRQRAHLSILRSTPSLMALFSLITLWAYKLDQIGLLTLHTTAWYKKENFTFADAIASIRARVWTIQIKSHSGFKPKCDKNEFDIYQHLAYMAARAV
jgi:hypothetical protein